ncbi:small multidrug resistance pump [Saccharopolyspora erythraea NRRL 2338]|uniref:Small multidrug resistance protein, SMR family n=2 Tax=Saccharopolyspora erythraea TaxID=1836 RepID=A4FQP7_SACEN|nr:SMR family transporter [Saccharopolyspora erythraea]EQD87673.1 multidrug transporter [Saccharopolyspora erythraea D]PFG92974.1 small multidrug resistance pump [Saccharopolyspora erythraea NRRL 2338]QRK89866.1 QacE family quaternary ammonium compound efflux SMR transporter [Saccharopolyspora erythraea]CAM06372.1 small multidrug resistance protein, SMR family [Saccharopolyspora erythraea NRRL 2338]
MAYLLLAVAILSEVTATVSLKLSEGFSKPVPSVMVVVGYLAAFAALGAVLKLGLPVGVVYAIWAGAGVALVAVIGAVFLGETITPVQIGGVVLIVGGVLALEMGGAH